MAREHRHVTVTISLEEVSDEDLVDEYFERFPGSPEEDIDTLCAGDIRSVEPAALAKLRQWLSAPQPPASPAPP